MTKNSDDISLLLIYDLTVPSNLSCLKTHVFRARIYTATQHFSLFTQQYCDASDNRHNLIENLDKTV